MIFILQVWLDDYKNVLYRRNPERFETVEIGDITREKLIRKNLNCKPFQYFLDFVMPDQVLRYPWQDFGVFASGTIRSESLPHICIDSLGRPSNSPLGLYSCHSNLTHPNDTQMFVLSRHRHINRPMAHDNCIDAYQALFTPCTYAFGNQLWFYNLVSLKISP